MYSTNPSTPEMNDSNGSPTNKEKEQQNSPKVIALGITLPTIGLMVGALALLFMMIALAVNDLSGYFEKEAGVSRHLTCRWNEYQMFSKAGSIKGKTWSKYKYLCDEQSKKYDTVCKTYNAGSTFAAFGIIVIIISGCTIIAAMSTKLAFIRPYVRWSFLVCAVFVLLAVIVWPASNSFDNSDTYWEGNGYAGYACWAIAKGGFRVGSSYILYIFAKVLYLVAFGITFLYPNIDDYQTFL